MQKCDPHRLGPCMGIAEDSHKALIRPLLFTNELYTIVQKRCSIFCCFIMPAPMRKRTRRTAKGAFTQHMSSVSDEYFLHAKVGVNYAKKCDPHRLGLYI